MKKLFLFSIAAALVMSCGEGIKIDLANPDGTLTFTAGAPVVKTTLSEDGKSVSWAAGDAINIFDANNASFQFTTSDSGSSASFSGTADGAEAPYFALYPYSASASFSYGASASTFTTSHNALDKGVCVAAADASNNLQFHNACAVLHFEITRSDLKSLVISSKSSTPLLGAISVTVDADGAISTITPGSGNSSITVGGTALAAGKYNLYVLPGTHTGGIGLLFTSTDGKTCECNVTADVEFKASERASFKDIDANVSFATVDAKTFPNCYIVAPGGSVTIPVAKAYAMWDATSGDEYLKGYEIDLTGTLSAGLLWQDKTDLISEVTLSGTDKNATITVKAAGTAIGNAVVYAKVGDNILWSWHVWINSFDAATNVKTLKADGGIVMMDRNLGADGYTGSKNYRNAGCYYQWGRKDPIPMLQSLSSTTFDSIFYGKDNTVLSLTDPKATSANPEDNISFAVKNPLSLVTASAGDWTTSASPKYNNTANLWGADGTKSAYDPCPEGWKVPSSADYSELVTFASDGKSLIWLNTFGRQADAYGFFASNGYLLSGGNPNNNVKNSVWLWTSTMTAGKNSAAGIYMKSTADAISVKTDNTKVRACGVRCIKE
ncbi:MAG: hypothetical protein KBS55_00620 [Bacteroidales bacterium]|nr:hypothetical protein [Candidatus Cryptobacteroides aphodequi]